MNSCSLRHRILQVFCTLYCTLASSLRLVKRWANRRSTEVANSITKPSNRQHIIGAAHHRREWKIAVCRCPPSRFLLECWPIELRLVCSFPISQPVTCLLSSIPQQTTGVYTMGRNEKPMAMLEAALDTAKDRPRASASIAAAVGVVGVFVLFSSKKVNTEADDAMRDSKQPYRYKGAGFVFFPWML